MTLIRQNSLVYEPTAKEVARTLLNSGAYLVRTGTTQDGFFDWKSKKKFAPVYVDVLKLAATPPAMDLVINSFVGAIRDRCPSAQYVIGLAEAGVIWSSTVAYALSLPHAFVRKAAKSHGLPGRVACSPPNGVKAVLIDDLIASGNSVLEAVNVLREECRIETVGILSVVNWDFEIMWKNLDITGAAIISLVSYGHVLDAAWESRLLSREAVVELEAFYRNPWTHKWNMDALRSLDAPPH
jgi:orotate phosphoribosyltransferase